MTDTLEACLQTEQVCFFYNGLDADTIFWDFGDGVTTSASPFDTVVTAIPMALVVTFFYGIAV